MITIIDGQLRGDGRRNRLLEIFVVVRVSFGAVAGVFGSCMYDAAVCAVGELAGCVCAFLMVSLCMFVRWRGGGGVRVW